MTSTNQGYPTTDDELTGLCAENERLLRAVDTWRELARSRKDQKLVDTIMTFEAELSVAQKAVLFEGAENDRLRAALERIASNESEDRDDCPHCIAAAALTGAPDAGSAR